MPLPKLKREYTIALTIMAGVLLLVFGINYLKGLDLLQKRNIYHAVYNDISGVSSSTPLFFRGLKVGQVVHTELMPDGSGRIALSVQVDEDRLRIPRDSRIRIYSADIFTRAVSLELGASTELAGQGDTLLGNAELSLTESVNEQIDPLKRKAEGMLANIDSVLTSLQKILNAEARGDIDASFSSIRQTLETLERTAARVDAVVAAESEALKSTIENVNAVSGALARNGDRMDRIFANLDTATTALAGGRLDSLIADLGSTSRQLNAMLIAMNQGKGTMGKLMKDDSLYNNLNAASAELELLLEDLRMNPNRYFSVFGKKDKLPKLSKADIERIRTSMEQELKD